MHISEGVLATPVLAVGSGLTLTGTAIGLRQLDYKRMPQVAILTSAFFVASFNSCAHWPFQCPSHSQMVC